MREVYSVLLNLKTPSMMNSAEEVAERKEVPMATVEETRKPKENPEIKSIKNEDDSEDHNSPRGVLEIPILGTDSDNSSSSSSSNYSSSSSSSTNTEKLHKDQALVPECHRLQWRNMIQLIKKKSLRRFSTFSLLTSSEISKRNLNRKLARIRSAEDRIEFECAGVPLVPKPSWRSFDFKELAAATNNFNSENLIGKGGHAEVYKGCLSDGQLVAVKRLMKKQNEEERTGDFLSELGIIAHIDHPNAARLLGFGVEGGLHLVLQFSPHGSLTSLLHERSLDWEVRFRVALGVAEGLNYLHQGCHRRIIHRDIKASNILLTEEFEPQISDFGLAKWLPDQWAHHIVFPIEGTFGYLAPEYFMHGIIDEKTDVFAFGVLLLELITGRRAVDSSRLSLVLWAKPLLDTNNVKELVDPRLGDDYNPVEMKNMTSTACMCIHHLSTRRPHMSRVVRLLRGENGSLEVMGKEQRPHTGRALLLEACDLEDYTCSSYINDLNRHRQLALE
ncbi:hypothetical protein AQUCO_00700516v1 [Aquilegia coerulea]|uniref:non-specific serine/threonine protein kinase n=1 Tax=Aquilegia coerulea TaxID=218851 RepID=A0A2G5EKG4_AQUCA|nr:hypothetical protein AQUCO_00700516v1 [Aquilegia coerulea]